MDTRHFQWFPRPNTPPITRINITHPKIQFLEDKQGGSLISQSIIIVQTWTILYGNRQLYKLINIQSSAWHKKTNKTLFMTKELVVQTPYFLKQ